MRLLQVREYNSGEACHSWEISVQTHTFFRRNTLIAGCLAAILSLAAQAAPLGGGVPQPPAFAMGHGETGPVMEELVPPQPIFLRGLELSEAQRDEVFTILHDQMPEVRKKSRAIRVAQDKLQALASSTQYDNTRARALAETAAKEMMELSLLRARSDQMIYTLLNPAQRKQVDDMKARAEASPEREPQGKRSPVFNGRPVR